jgi:hypothetical protein
MAHNLPKEYEKTGYINKLLNSWLEKENYYSVDMRKAGFGPIWIILGLPNIIFAVLRNCTKSKLLYTAVFIFLVLFLIHPSNWWTRYTIYNCFRIYSFLALFIFIR